MTAYSKTITETHSAATDTLVRSSANHRTFSESGGSSDLPLRASTYVRGSSDTLSPSSSVLRTGGYGRRESETLIHAESPIRVFGSHRGETETSSTFDVLASNQIKAFSLSETLSPSSSIARKLGAKRSTPEILTPSQSLLRIHGARRLIAQTSVTSDALTKHWTSVRAFTESHPGSSSILRFYRARRINSDGGVGGQLEPSQTLVPSPTLWGTTSPTSDAVQRIVHFRRSEFDPYIYRETTGRSTGSRRTVSQSLTTSDFLVIAHGNHPRSVSEVLTHSDQLIYSLMGPILGSLWYDPIGRTFYEFLPNWEFKLLPGTGLDGLYYAPKASPSVNPNREK